MGNNSRGAWRRVKSMIRREVIRATTRTRVVRVRIKGGSIAANGVTTFSLLTTSDSPNEDLATDGTNVGEVETGSKLIGVKLKMIIKGNAGFPYEWVFYKDPDNEGIFTNPSTLHTTGDVSAIQSSRRKHALKYDYTWIASASDARFQNLSIRRAALRRVRILGEGDRLELQVENFHSTNAAELHLIGKFLTRV